MKVVGIVGSPRKNGNTEMLTAHTLRAIAEEGLDTELIPLAGLEVPLSKQDAKTMAEKALNCRRAELDDLEDLLKKCRDILNPTNILGDCRKNLLDNLIPLLFYK